MRVSVAAARGGSSREVRERAPTRRRWSFGRQNDSQQGFHALFVGFECGLAVIQGLLGLPGLQTRLCGLQAGLQVCHIVQSARSRSAGWPAVGYWVAGCALGRQIGLAALKGACYSLSEQDTYGRWPTCVSIGRHRHSNVHCRYKSYDGCRCKQTRGLGGHRASSNQLQATARASQPRE